MALRREQVVARHPLGLRSLWDARIAEGDPPGDGTEEQLFTTWKIRPDGQARRVIDYIWCVQVPNSPHMHAPPTFICRRRCNQQTVDQSQCAAAYCKDLCAGIPRY